MRRHTEKSESDMTQLNRALEATTTAPDMRIVDRSHSAVVAHASASSVAVPEL